MIKLNRTTNKIFKFIHKHPVGINLQHLYAEFPNKTAVYESYKFLVDNKLITQRDGHIELTLDGYDYYYNIRKAHLINIASKFVIPIIIAILSSIITAKFISSTEECKCDVTCNYTDNYNDDNINNW